MQDFQLLCLGALLAQEKVETFMLMWTKVAEKSNLFKMTYKHLFRLKENYTFNESMATLIQLLLNFLH